MAEQTIELAIRNCDPTKATRHYYVTGTINEAAVMALIEAEAPTQVNGRMRGVISLSSDTKAHWEVTVQYDVSLASDGRTSSLSVQQERIRLTRAYEQVGPAIGDAQDYGLALGVRGIGWLIGVYRLGHRLTQQLHSGLCGRATCWL